MPINPCCAWLWTAGCCDFSSDLFDVRKKYGLPAFKLERALSKRSNHLRQWLSKILRPSKSYNRSLRNLDDRVEQFDRRYFELAENIAEIDLIDVIQNVILAQKGCLMANIVIWTGRTHRLYKMMSYWRLLKKLFVCGWILNLTGRNILHPEMRALLDVCCPNL